MMTAAPPHLASDLAAPGAGLFLEAERARWRFDDVPWGAVDRGMVTPELVRVVRDAAVAEATTFSATQRFLHEFADDLDFTSWVAVWFYEESKHPQALLRWLAEVGESVDAETLRRGRVTAPFVKSRMGTLVANVISEQVASHNYLHLASTCGEPVLAQVARHLACDEARHAASFYSFARARLARSPTPEQERRDALKVLHLWLGEGTFQHPVRLFRSADGFVPPAAGVEGRILRSIGILVGAPLRTSADVLQHLRETSHGTT